MSLPLPTPALRIEIRAVPAAGAEDSAPWSVFDTAFTAAQAEDKIARADLAKGYETRVVPNAALVSAAPVIVDSPETRAFLEQTGARMLRIEGTLAAKQKELDTMKATIAAAQQLDALAGETPPPFAVGQTLRDVHTGVAVRVTELNTPFASGTVRAGFSWATVETTAGQPNGSGFCPLASAGCFIAVDASAPAVIAPSGVETPSPAPVPAEQVRKTVTDDTARSGAFVRGRKR